MQDRIQADVLVVGSGIAGAVCALRLAELGHEVLLISNHETATGWAQGGIVYQGLHDPQALFEDIWKAGCGLSYRPAVEKVVQEGPKLVQQWLLNKLKVPFDRHAPEQLDLCLEAAHSEKRILHVKDQTGRAIQECLDKALNNSKQITRLQGTLVDLLLTHIHDERAEKTFESAQVAGAYVWSPKEQKVKTIVAKAVVLATGGFSQLYWHSTGPSGNRGDGISAAHRAGARTMGLEYVQFHPTALYLEGERRYLLTEALRGAGAKILNLSQKPFLDELAPRDVVARGIHEEMLSHGATHVWLDLRAVADLASRFPHIVKLLNEKGIDPFSQLIPIVPAAHYTMGGVWTNLKAETSLPGLYAAGEVACTGLHGANRLASTSLLEALVFGVAAAENASIFSSHNKIEFQPKIWRYEESPVDPALLQQDWLLLKQTMWNYIGLVRTEKRLKRAERLLVELRTEIESFYKKSFLSDELLGLRHGVLVATLVLYAALRNRESVGSHYLRKDDESH